MKMIVVECPKCKGSLQVNENLEKIFCMYCRAEVVVKSPEQTGGGAGATADSLIKRGFLLVEHQDWEKAVEVFDQAANIDPENAQVYLGMLLTEARVKKENALGNHDQPLTKYPSYQKAIRFADPALREKLEKFNELAQKNAARKQQQRDRQKEHDKHAEALRNSQVSDLKRRLKRYFWICLGATLIIAILLMEIITRLVNGFGMGEMVARFGTDYIIDALFVAVIFLVILLPIAYFIGKKMIVNAAVKKHNNEALRYWI